MAIFKLTALFNSAPGDFGWSESYFMDGLSDYPSAIAAAELWWPVRRKVLIDQAQLVVIRISDENKSNDSLLVTPTDTIGDVVTTEFSYVQPWTALLSRNQAGPEHRGRTYFHGVLEDTFFANRSYDPANTQNAFWLDLGEFMATHFSLAMSSSTGVWTYQPFTAVFFLRSVVRKVGRPFGLLAGKRRTKKLEPALAGPSSTTSGHATHRI